MIVRASSNWPHRVERWSFGSTILSGCGAAIAGGLGEPISAITLGLLAAASPIAGRIAGAKINGPRALTPAQASALAKRLRQSQPCKVRINHNRHEAEQAEYHRQLTAAIGAGGWDPEYFGGCNNNTVGVEVSGPDGPSKVALMEALRAGGVRFLPIVLTDASPGRSNLLEVWIGVHPATSNSAHWR